MLKEGYTLSRSLPLANQKPKTHIFIKIESTPL